MKFLFVHLSIKDVLHSVSVSVLVPICALTGLMMPSQPLIADLSYDERFLKVVTSRFARYSGIAAETYTDPCD